jgi:small-conductance mechanosensitive channel
MKRLILTYGFLLAAWSSLYGVQVDSNKLHNFPQNKVDSIALNDSSSKAQGLVSPFQKVPQAPLRAVIKPKQIDTVDAETSKVADLRNHDEVQEAKQEELANTTNSDGASRRVSSQEVPPLSELLSWGKIIWSLIIILIAHFTIKLLVIIIERFAERSVKHRMTLKSVSPVLRILSWTLVLIIIIHGIIRPPIETIFAVTASVGIAVGFAAQDILKNIFGGIMILFDRPFQVGDKIEVGEHYGEVKEIGLRSTRIVTKDDSLVSIPNAEVVNKAVSNANSGEANCQVVAEIYLPVDVDTNKARKLAVEAAQVSQYIYLNKPITVVFINEVKEKRSFLKMRLKAYVSDIRYEFAFQSDMTEIVMREFLDEGIIDKSDIS